MDDFDEIFENFFDELEDDDEPPAPDFRATIREGKVMLTGWAPFLATGGPVGNFFEARRRAGVAIADLTLHGEDRDEVSVRFFSDGGDQPAAERSLVRWARHCGYRRLWLPDGLVEIQPGADRIGRATVRCPTCLARWSDSNPEFWLAVHQGGAFPRWCPLCGCEMPQWRVSRKAARHEPYGDVGESAVRRG